MFYNLFKKNPDKNIKNRYFSVFNCNLGCCSLEVDQLLLYYEKGINIEFVDSPKHANVLLITGLLSLKNVDIVKNIYYQMDEKCFVIIAGSCSLSGGLFQNSYVSKPKIEDFLIPDVCVYGCPPSPKDIIDGFKRLKVD